MFSFQEIVSEWLRQSDSCSIARFAWKKDLGWNIAPGIIY